MVFVKHWGNMIFGRLFVRCWGVIGLNHAYPLNLEPFLYIFQKHLFLGMRNKHCARLSYLVKLLLCNYLYIDFHADIQ
jgi:hypothetical protein